VKLSKKILYSNIFFLVLPCFILFLWIVLLIQEDGERKLDEAKLLLLERINETISTNLKNVQVYSDFLYGNKELNKLLSMNDYKNEYESLKTDNLIKSNLVKNFILYGDNHYYVEILAENGKKYSTLSDDEKVDFGDLSKLKGDTWYKSLKENSRIHYIPGYYNKELFKKGKYTINCMRIIKNFNSGREIALMNIVIKNSYFENLFNKSVDTGKYSIVLLDNNNNMIEGDADFKLELISLTKIKNIDKGYYKSKDNNSKLYFVTNEMTSWKLIMYEKNAKFVIPTPGIIVILVSMGFLILSIFMSYYNSKYINKSIQKLKRGMKTVSVGNLSFRADENSDDELVELSVQFNKMVNKIEELMCTVSKQDEEKRVLELRALQAQISPHFLYNTLASIRFLIDMGTPERAEECLVALARLLNITFSDYRKLIPLGDELEALKNYLILMQNRYQDKFTWDIEMELGMDEYLIPRISIQPIVENTILHGFSKKSDRGHIYISLHKCVSNYTINIKDDGIGANIEEIEKKLSAPEEVFDKKQSGGIGINNVEKRIKLFFGDNYGIRVYKNSDGGLTSVITLPIKISSEEGK
jgi:hypothetical protein